MEKETIFMERLASLNKKERLVAFYKSQKFADCTFKLNGAEVKAHKLILACSSPVFEKMFFGDMASNEIVISDINEEEFNQVLEFIYTEIISITSIVNAWSLFYVANKYLLDDLIKVCLQYIQKNLTMNTLVLSYEYAEMYGLRDIKKKCFSDIVGYVNGAFSSDYHMKSSTLSAILEEENIGLDKFEMVVHILSWSEIECDFRKVLVTPENIVEILKEEDILKFIKKDWLISIKCDECCDALVMCQCVDELVHECLLLLDEDLTWSEESCETQKLYKPMQHICRLRKEFKIACRVDLHSSEEYVCSVSVNRQMILFGILVNTEMNPTGYFGTGYEGSITVRVCEQNCNASIAKPTTFKGVIYYDSDLYLSLKDLVVLEPNILYDIKISYKNRSNIGVTPVHCYYMSNKLTNDSKDSIVSFYEICGTLVKGLSFYAA